MGSILHAILGFMLMGVLGLLIAGLGMMILLMIFGAFDQFVLDGKLTPIAKHKIQKIFKLA